MGDYGLTDLGYIASLFSNAYSEDAENAKRMIKKIFEYDLEFSEYNFMKYAWLSNFLDIESQKSNETLSTEIYDDLELYLDIEQVPDNFYRDLISLINKSYMYEIYDAVLIFNRKLIENLIIEILRNHYGIKNIESIKKYYYIDGKRFQNFKILVSNFKDCLNDLNHIEPSLNNIIQLILTFRKTANKTAHSIVVNTKKEDVDVIKDTLNDIVKTLIRIILIQRTHIR